MDRILDNTALSAYMRCPSRYHKEMVLHRRARGVSAALEYGKCMHTMFEVLYKTHDAELAKAAAAVKYAETLGSTTDYRTLDRAILTFDEWLIKWGHPGSEIVQRTERTVGFPESPAVELSTNVMLPIAQMPYAVRIDRVFEMDGAYFIEDHKTTSVFGATFYDEYDLSGQMMGYMRTASLLLGREIRGVRLNVLATRKASTEFDRRIIYYSADQLEGWERNLLVWKERIERSHETNSWPKSFASCSTKYGMCTYAPVCSAGPAFEDRALELDFDINPWDPNAQHDD